MMSRVRPVKYIIPEPPASDLGNVIVLGTYPKGAVITAQEVEARMAEYYAEFNKRFTGAVIDKMQAGSKLIRAILSSGNPSFTIGIICPNRFSRYNREHRKRPPSLVIRP